MGEHHRKKNKDQDAADINQQLNRSDKIGPKENIESRDAPEGP